LVKCNAKISLLACIESKFSTFFYFKKRTENKKTFKKRKKRDKNKKRKNVFCIYAYNLFVLDAR